MIGVLANRRFAVLFSAQVVALLGSGLLTVALGLLAYDLAGDRAGAVLGSALTIKMVTYVGLSPVAQALMQRLPRGAVLIGADLIRAAVALCLPLVTEIWQVYALIFVLQAASATFTPAFQATIPELLPDEGAYTRALSLSRLAYDLENLLSPALAALLLMVMSYSALFVGTFLGFGLSALLIARTSLPAAAGDSAQRPFRERLTRGSRIYLATPRLRGLLSLNLSASAAGAFVLVNTVVVVRGPYAGTEGDLALAMAAFGAGSMSGALLLPRLLERLGDRPVMLWGGWGLVALTAGLALALWLGAWPAWSAFLGIWGVLGLAYACVLTPSGRLLRRSAHPEDRPAVFAAQFALSHACWLVTYPLAGWAGAGLGMAAALALLSLLALGGVVAARWLWPADLPHSILHEHPDLPADHPHLRAHGGRRHTHAVIIDDAHPVWPDAR